MKPSDYPLIKPAEVCRVLGISYPSLSHDVLMARFPVTDTDGQWYAHPEFMALLDSLRDKPRARRVRKCKSQPATLPTDIEELTALGESII